MSVTERERERAFSFVSLDIRGKELLIWIQWEKDFSSGPK